VLLEFVLLIFKSSNFIKSPKYYDIFGRIYIYIRSNTEYIYIFGLLFFYIYIYTSRLYDVQDLVKYTEYFLIFGLHTYIYIRSIPWCFNLANFCGKLEIFGGLGWNIQLLQMLWYKFGPCIKLYKFYQIICIYIFGGDYRRYT